MHSLCFQSFGTNEISAKEEKRFGIYENELCHIYVVGGRENKTKLNKNAAYSCK